MKTACYKMLINQPPDFKKVVLWPTQVKLLVLLCTVRSVKVKIFYAFYTNKIKCIFLNLILFIILSIHRKEAHSAVLTSDESGVLCGPGCFNSSDQEVGLLSSVECLHMVSGYTRHSFPPFPVNWGLLLIRFTKETSECPVAFNFL